MNDEKIADKSAGSILLSVTVLLLVIAAVLIVAAINPDSMPGGHKVCELRDRFISFVSGKAGFGNDPAQKTARQSEDAGESDTGTVSEDGEVQPRIPENNGERSDPKVKSWF